jgi:hypothetical protein
VLAGTHCGLYKGSYNTLNTLSWTHPLHQWISFFPTFSHLCFYCRKISLTLFSSSFKYFYFRIGF